MRLIFRSKVPYINNFEAKIRVQCLPDYDFLAFPQFYEPKTTENAYNPIFFNYIFFCRIARMQTIIEMDLRFHHRTMFKTASSPFQRST